ncbi:MAG: hypothetical protein Q9199_000658 [Rusavskia elegans]
MGKERVPRRADSATPKAYLPPMDKCDYKEHAFPFFCPLSFVDYKSQKSPDIMEYISTKHHLNTEGIKLQDTDKFKLQAPRPQRLGATHGKEARRGDT